MPVTDLRQPGDFCVCSISGWGGGLIGVGERWLNAGRPGVMPGGFRRFRHALVYVGYGLCLQAEPAGSQLVTRPITDGDLWSTGYLDPPPAVAAQVRAEAAAMGKQWEHIPYSGLDYLSLAAKRSHLPNLRIWPNRYERGQGYTVDHQWQTLQEFITDSGHMMCSQLVDAYLDACGWHLFDDGRWFGDVDPYDLGALILGATHKGM